MRILFWFRKDLRLEDNTGLREAASDSGGQIVPFYASEPALLARNDIAAVRVQFVLESLEDLARAIARTGSSLILDHGHATDTVLRAARAAGADAVYWNDEYEPALIERDDEVEAALRAEGLRVRRFHDRLLLPPEMVMAKSGKPYVMFTPFARSCGQLPLATPLPAVRRFAAHSIDSPPPATLERLGFESDVPRWPGGSRAAHRRLARFLERQRGYATDRDHPGLDATSNLSADLKFGTLSPRTVAAAVLDRWGRTDDSDKLITQLRWRDFYAHMLFHFPHTEHSNYQSRYDTMTWEGELQHFEAWAAGQTGYPIVDAGMRQLRTTGFMHNRVRMTTASFLTKDLLIDWRYGARHFMQHLVDGDLANNTGGWQWAASTGTDPQPYFRVFNPTLQGEKFDRAGDYVRRWVPELSGLATRWLHRPWEAPAAALEKAGVRIGTTYPEPIVDHAVQRLAAIAMFKS